MIGQRQESGPIRKTRIFSRSQSLTMEWDEWQVQSILQQKYHCQNGHIEMMSWAEERHMAKREIM